MYGLDAQLLAQAKAVDVGQHDVEHKQVVWRHGGQRQTILAVVGDVDSETVFFQAALEHAGQFVFVFDD